VAYKRQKHEALPLSFIVETQVELAIVIDDAKFDKLQPALSAKQVAPYFATLSEVDNR